MTRTKTLRLLISVLLVVSGALSVSGFLVERSTVRQAGSMSNSEVGGENSDNGAESSSGHSTEANEKVLGVSLDSPALVALAVGLSFGLALLVLVRASKPLLLALVVFSLGFAAFDALEVIHQARDSRTLLILIASAVLLVHIVIAILAGIGSKRFAEASPA